MADQSGSQAGVIGAVANYNQAGMATGGTLTGMFLGEDIRRAARS